MSTFTINNYLVDENNDYVVTETGDRIILSTSSITVDFSAAAAGSNNSQSTPVLSFQVKKRTDNDWYLIVNRDRFVGQFPSQSLTMGALYGIYIGNNGHPDGFSVWLEDSINLGFSEIDPAINDLKLLRDGNNTDNYLVELRSYDPTAITPSSGTLMVAIQYRDYGQQFKATGNILDADIAVIDASTPTSVISGVNNYLFTNGWLNQAENASARAVIVDNVAGTYSVTNVIGTPVIVKDEVDPSVISFTVAIDGAVTGGFADAVVTDNSTVDPVRHPEGVSFTYEWAREIPSLTGLSSPGAIENVYGQTSILADLKTSNAKVAFFGDSISNNGGTSHTSFWHAALFEWHPTSWKGAYFHADGSTTGMFTNVNSTRFSGNPITRPPGGTDTTLPELDREGMRLRGGELDGTANVAVQMQFATSSLSSLQSVRTSQAVLGRWPDGAQIFEKTDGTRDIATQANRVQMGCRVLAGNNVDHVTTGSSWQLRNPGSTNNTGTIAYNPTLNTGLTVYSPEIDSSTGDTIDYIGTEGGNWNLIYRSSTSQAQKHWAMDGVFYGGQNDGLTISYYGDGGWTTGSHRPPGDLLTTTNGTDQYHYTPEYLSERASLEGTTHAYIHIGQNDIAGSVNRNGSQALASFDAMVANIKAQIPGVKIIVSTIYDTEIDDASNLADKAVFNNGIITRASSDPDMVCVDLNAYIKEQKPTLAEFTDDWLMGTSGQAGTDRIHPNQAGASAIMSYLWDRVEAVQP